LKQTILLANLFLSLFRKARGWLGQKPAIPNLAKKPVRFLNKGRI
jgi:hypothetical protein